jgi:tetratricopeptide (TPR) repeat protein
MSKSYLNGWLLVMALLLPWPALAQSWKPAYDGGVSAIKRKDYKDAVQSLERAVPLAEQEFDNAHPNYVNTLLKLGEAYLAIGNQDKGRTPYLTVVTIKKEKRDDRTKEYADLLGIIAKSYQDSRDYLKADGYYVQCLNARRSIQGEKHSDFVATQLAHARMYRSIGKYEKAEALYTQCHKQAKETWGEKEARYREMLAEMGEVYAKLKQPEKSAEFYQAHLAAMKAQKQAPASYLASHLALGTAYQLLKKYPEASKQYLEYLAQLKATKGEKDQAYLDELNRMVDELGKMGENEAAISLLKQKSALQKQLKGEKSYEYALALNEQAASLGKLKLYPDAQAALQSSLAVLAELKKEPAQEVTYAETLGKMASLLAHMGDPAGAEATYLKTVDYLKVKLGEAHPAFGRGLDSLAFFYLGTEKLTLADSLLKTTLELRKKAPGEKHPDYATSQANYAQVLAKKGKFAEAEALLKQSSKNVLVYFGGGSREYARSTYQLAALYRAAKNYPEAMKNYRAALELQKRSLGEAHPETAQTLQNIATLTEEMNKK